MASASPIRMPGRTPFASAVAVTEPISGSVPGSGASAAGAVSRPGLSRSAARRSKAGMAIAAITGNVCSTRTDVRRQLRCETVDTGVEQPFHTDLEYYAGRADGIATTSGIGVDEARDELAQRHGFERWEELAAHVTGMASGAILPTAFVL